MKKSEAIGLVNSIIKKDVLDGSNTTFSNINKAKPVWWLNIDPDKLNYDLFLLLVEKKELYVFHIPPNSIKNPTSKFRLKGNLLDIEIGCNQGFEFLKDIKSGGTMFNFNQYLLDKLEL